MANAGLDSRTEIPRQNEKRKSKRVKKITSQAIDIDPRIVVEIFKNNQPIDMEQVVKKGGELGNFTAQDEIVLQVSVISSLAPQLPGNFIGLSCDGEHRVTEKKNHSNVPGITVYRSVIPVKATTERGGRTVTVSPFCCHPTNHIKVAELYKNGHVKMWEVAMVSENGNFFVTVQQTYDTWAYRENGKVTLPALNRWLSMMKVLNKHLDPRRLKDIAEFTSTPEITADGLENNQGRIAFFNKAMGFGIVKTANGDEKIHWTELDFGHRSEFRPGEIVSIEVQS